MKYRLAAMIMAAGESSRFGSCKHLARLGNTTVLQHVVDVAKSRFTHHVYVVTGRYRDEIERQIQHARFIYNPEWPNGLGKSIATGVTDLAGQYEGLLILLGDQVALDPGHLDQLIDAYDNEQIISAQYYGKNGVPALFPRSHYHILQRLNGTKGAKALLNHPDVVVKSIKMTVAAVDIDSKNDLASFTNQS